MTGHQGLLAARPPSDPALRRSVRRGVIAGMFIRIAAVFAIILVATPVAAQLASSPELGKAEGHCRTGESSTRLLVAVVGLKDRKGSLKLEVYPANESDFLQDDNILLNQGKVFRRVEAPVPPNGPVELCIRLPGPGSYSIVLLHDRNRNHKFDWMADGVGFGGNPRLGWTKPKASDAKVTAALGINRVSMVLNYRQGLRIAPLP